MIPPKWTLFYNILHTGQKYIGIGTGYEFYDNEAAANRRFLIHQLAGNNPTLRPYCDKVDHAHLMYKETL